MEKLSLETIVILQIIIKHASYIIYVNFQSKLGINFKTNFHFRNKYITKK